MGTDTINFAKSCYTFLCLTLTFFLLWILCVINVLCLSCFRVCSLLPCGHLEGRSALLALVCDVYCDFDTFHLVSWDRCGDS